MKLYFVRHGETTHNISNLHQHGRVELTKNGLHQAQSVAPRFKKIPIEIVVCSNFKRARQTAEKINKITKKQVIFTALLQEVKRPTEIEDKKFDDPEAVRIKKIIRDHVSDPSWHYSDEENFYDVKERMQEFITYISKRKEENIVVVLHGFVMRMIIGLMMFGDDFTREMYEHFLSFYAMNNTGITVCEKKENNKWQLITWNDHAHLGE